MTATANGIELWPKFKEAFMQAVRMLPPRDRAKFCAGPERRYRTEIYKTRVLPDVGRRLGLTLGGGHLTIDAHYKDSGGYPYIFIEYENVATTAKQEVEKLCYVRSPLKILITVRGPDDKLKQEWSNSVRESWREWLPESDKTVYGFVTGPAPGVRGPSFCFFSLATRGDSACEEKDVSETF